MSTTIVTQRTLTHPDDRCLSVSELFEAFTQFEYHPDSEIYVAKTDNSVRVTLVKTVRNAYRPENNINIQTVQEYHASSGYTVNDVLDLFRTLVYSMEVHEADEWIKFNGKTVFDPHDISKVEQKHKRRSALLPRGWFKNAV